MKNLQSSIVIGIMCFLLSFGIAVQIASIEKESTVLAVENTENKLRDEVLQLTDEYNRAYSKLQKSEKKLEKLRNSVSENNELTKSWSEELEKINNYLGLTTVKGNGIRIEIENGDLVPVEYKVIDIALIKKVIKDTKGKVKIPGVKIIEKKIVRVK